MCEHPSWTTLLAAAATIALAGCGGGEPDTADEAAPAAQAAPTPDPERAVVITDPAPGDTVDGPAVTVRLEAVGFTVVPAGDTTANSGHHHVFLDRDLSPLGEPIPAEEGFIVHMGDGSAELTLENVQPGEHRLIALLGDALHVPIEPVLSDTVVFVVR